MAVLAICFNAEHVAVEGAEHVAVEGALRDDGPAPAVQGLVALANDANQALIEAVGGETFNSTTPPCMVVAIKSTPAQLEQEKALSRKSFGLINKGILKARRTITKQWKAINGAWDKIKSGWSNMRAVRKAFQQSRQTRINAAAAVRRAQKAQEANEKKLQDALNDNVATCTATGKTAHTCSAVCLEDNLGNCDQSQCSKCNICSLKAQLNTAKKTVNIKAKAVEEAEKDEANVEMQRINAGKDQAKAEEATAADLGSLKTNYAKYVHDMIKTAVDTLTTLEAGLKKNKCSCIKRSMCITTCPLGRSAAEELAQTTGCHCKGMDKAADRTTEHCAWVQQNCS